MDSNVPLPAGLLAHGSLAQIAADFDALALLQPVRATVDGIVCAPRAAPELARRGYARCALALSPLDTPPAWPDPPSRTAGRWFIRSPQHIPAPAGYHELVLEPGEGFGAWPHPTTHLCLIALDGLTGGRALDLGCGSGLLSQAWAASHGPVVGVDLDPKAIAHAAASRAHARPAFEIVFRRAPIARVLPEATAPVLLANVPPVVHEEITRTLAPAARTLLVSGVRTDDAPATLARYRRLGFAVTGISDADGWGCWVLARD
jgi:ribosomal protein L11 methylase PrmA